MWGCEYLPYSGDWWGSFFPWNLWLLLFLITVLFIVLMSYAVNRLIKTHTHNSFGSSRDEIDSLAILKARFTKGEISHEEFIKMKRSLS